MRIRQIGGNDRDKTTRHYPIAFYYIHQNQRDDEVIRWCVEQFGNFVFTSVPGRIAWDFGAILRYILFHDPADATAFKVRWM